MFFFVKVNRKVINVFYLFLKMKVKVVSVKMKSGILKMVFLTISLLKTIFLFYLLYFEYILYIIDGTMEMI